MTRAQDEHLADIESLQRSISYTFESTQFASRALTHSTFANENPEIQGHNERLEFLGDAVLDLLVAEILFADEASIDEGEMSKRRAAVVKRDALAQHGAELDLGSLMRLGQGQRKSGETPNILADAFEAVVAAVFLDGGMSAVRTAFKKRFSNALMGTALNHDAKTRLQEISHVRGLGAPSYIIVDRAGPVHQPSFVCEIFLDEKSYGKGSGGTKKAAEQQAAATALQTIEHSTNTTSE